MIYMLDMWDDISFTIISGIYGTVARVYDILLQVINGHQNVSYTFESFATNIYVLAGVFIIFRVAIGMIQMIINPDQMSDKQQGAGKMIIRIVTCVIMLLVFYPGGLIFGKDGILNRLEVAIMGTGTNANGEERDGLIENIFDIDADAAGKELNCYYYYVDKDESVSNDVTTLKGLYHVTYTLENRSGYTKMKTPIKYTGGSVYYKVDTGTTMYKNNEIKFESINGTLYDKGMYFKNRGVVWNKDKDNAILPSKCPKYIKENDPSTGETVVNENGTIQKNTIYGGYKKLENMVKDVKLNYNANDVTTDNEFWKDEGVGSGKNLINKMIYGEDSLKFSQGVAKSFQNCSLDKKECDELQEGMFNEPDINDKIKTEMDGGNFTVDFLTSLIAGIAIIVYLIVLCVDVIIRQLKMLLLEMLSPIAIVSYADPKDKVFPKWTKMLVSTYLELFIKIIGIKIATILIAAIWDAKDPFGGNLLIMFFYIVAILVFAKIVPSMISKLFGLDNMGGSFKDIMGMAKGAVGFGAGAAIGGAVGLATGLSAASQTKGIGNKMLAGAGAIGSGFSGFAKGAGAGSKGKIFSAAKDVSGKNATRRQLYAGGIRPQDLVAASTLGRIGMDKASRVDKSNLRESERLASLKKGDQFMKNMKEGAQSTKFFKSLRDYASDPNNDFRLTEKQWGDVEDAVASAHLMGADEEDRANDVLLQKLAAAGVSQDVLGAAWGMNADGEINNMIDGKQRGIMQADAELYDEFFRNSSSAQELVREGKHLSQSELDVIASTDSSDRYMGYKNIDKSIKTESREINKEIEKSKLDPNYGAAAAAKNAGNNKK